LLGLRKGRSASSPLGWVRTTGQVMAVLAAGASRVLAEDALEIIYGFDEYVGENQIG